MQNCAFPSPASWHLVNLAGRLGPMRVIWQKEGNSEEIDSLLYASHMPREIVVVTGDQS